MKTVTASMTLMLCLWFSGLNVQAAPTPPSNAQVRRIPEQLHLTWQDNSSDEYYFIVERKISIIQPSWQVAATLPPNRTSYQESDLVSNRTYTFRVRALGEYGYSEYSNETSVTTSPMIFALKISSPNGGEALPAGSVYPIAWSNNYLPTPPAQVNLDYSLDAGSTWNNIKTNYPNTEIYYWKVPEEISADGLIRVSSATSSTTYDLSNQVFSIMGYDFNINAGHGWTVSEVVDEDGYLIDEADFRFSWVDRVNYPLPPGTDPVGNRKGSVGIIKNTVGLIRSSLWNLNAKYWNQRVISPDLTNLSYWQKANGFTVEIANCMQTGAKLYCSLIVDVHDHDTQTFRTFTYPANASQLTYAPYGTGEYWNYRVFRWSFIPNFPTNFTLKRIYVSIWGDLGWNYQNEYNGAVFIDHLMPIWPFWDFNADGVTSLYDFAAFSSAWQTNTSDPTWNPVFDGSPVNNQVDLLDLKYFAASWLKGR